VKEVRSWQVYRYDLRRCWGDLGPALDGYASDLASWVLAWGGRAGQPFLIGPDGRPDPRVNGFFASNTMRNRDPKTNSIYSRSLGIWLNFLLTQDRRWWEATEEDAEGFRFWRMTDPRNPERVRAKTFGRDMAALRKFYRWTGRFGVADPFVDMDDPVGRRSADVKWFDPAGYRRWRDLGLAGFGMDGRPDPTWRGRNEQRDTAFADALYGTGLRLSELSSVVIPELPERVPGRGYYTCALADQCAKGGNGHAYWMPRPVLAGLLSYIEIPRAAAVRRAQVAGRYDRLDGIEVVGKCTRTRLKPSGGGRGTAWNDVEPERRLRLFARSPEGLEPLALWLNEDGLPRDAHGWHHSFTVANERIERLGLVGFSGAPHMLRHSFALKWYSIAKLARSVQLGSLGSDQARDWAEEFGDVWHLVQTMLGHRSVQSTKNVYLEPFQNLEVELLLAQAEGFPTAQFMAEVFAGHPRVRTDPLRGQ
jgi:site-specific recombinase XerD